MGVGSNLRAMAAPPVALAAALLALAGCGGERSFDADEIVAELGAAGTELVLGETLPSDRDDVEVRVIEFADAPAGDEGTAGTVVILDGTQAASEEFARCQAAISFVCFRAANAVLRFTDIGPGQRERVSASLERIATSPAD